MHRSATERLLGKHERYIYMSWGLKGDLSCPWNSISHQPQYQSKGILFHWWFRSPVKLCWKGGGAVLCLCGALWGMLHCVWPHVASWFLLWSSQELGLLQALLFLHGDSSRLSLSEGGLHLSHPLGWVCWSRFGFQSKFVPVLIFLVLKQEAGFLQKGSFFQSWAGLQTEGPQAAVQTVAPLWPQARVRGNNKKPKKKKKKQKKTKDTKTRWGSLESLLAL